MSQVMPALPAVDARIPVDLCGDALRGVPGALTARAAETADWWTGEFWLATAPEHVRLARKLVGTCLGEECAAAYDTKVVVSELLANACRHGGDGPVYLRLGHGGGLVVGVLLQTGANGDVPVVTSKARAHEMARLAAPDGAPDIDIASLGECGRGLAVIDGIAPGWTTTLLAMGRLTHWHVTCGCGASRGGTPDIAP